MPCKGTKTLEIPIKSSANSEMAALNNQEMPTHVLEDLNIDPPRRSTDSTVPDESTLFTKTTKKIIGGKLIKKKA